MLKNMIQTYPKLRTNKTSAGIAFLKGSLANTIRVNAAASIVPPNNNPAHKATTGIQILSTFQSLLQSQKLQLRN